MPNWLRTILPITALVVASLAAGWAINGWRHEARLQSVMAEQIERQALVLEMTRDIEQRMNQYLEKERETYESTIREMQAALDAADSQSDRLRNTIAAERRRAAALAASTGGDHGASASPWVVLDECREEYVKVAKAADDLAARLGLAAGYAKAVSQE